MNLTSEQVSNLCLLADFMEGLDDPTFTMTCYAHDCETPACAFGHACTIPALKRKGLHFNLTQSSYLFERYDAMRRVFGETQLFQSGLHETIRTPQQWAAYCRAFLKENGYDITKPDPFKIFMEKTLERVETQEPEFHHWRTA